MKKQQNGFIDLIINIIIPAIVLVKLSNEDYLGPVYGLVIALLFPILYGCYDLIQKKKVNFFSVFGLVSIFFTGGIGLLHLDVKWIAIKEAAVPLIIGIVVIGSTKTSFPLVKKIIEQVIDFEKVELALKEHQVKKAFDERLKKATYIIGASFFLSAVLNFILAKMIVVSPTGTSEFTAELGKLTALSYPVIALPSTLVLVIAIWFLISGIIKLTQLEFKEIVKNR